MAWVREVKDTKELVVATDSRLRFGRAWDCCPKILPLPRNDAVVCFAGDTMYAYPVMLQMFHAIAMHERLLSRAMDLSDLKGHLLRVLNSMHSQIHDLPKSETHDAPSVAFMLAGYSWKANNFKIWQYYFNPATRKFAVRGKRRERKKILGTKVFEFVGDHVRPATIRLHQLVANKNRLRSKGFDMEPFEVLVEMIRDPQLAEIGGAPQVMKIYKFSNSIPYSVYWPNRDSNTLTLWGRPLLAYERHRYLAIDPDSLEVGEP